MRSASMLSCIVVLLVASSADAAAQRQARIVGSDELNSAVVARADGVSQERARLRALLARPEVRDVAREHAIDMERVERAVETMGAEDLQQVAPLVQGVTTELAGGQSITITATTLILIILLVLLILVIAD